MAKKSRIITAVLSATGMAVLILDSKTALSGATEGIEICIRTVIPSLFPFFVLSILLTSVVSGTRISFLSPFGKLFGIPGGAESLLLIGLIGGYPVGAQAVTEAYNCGCITKKDAHRLLGFCSNAGPAFIFGIAGSLFSSKAATFLLWGIHILSALVVGVILPGRSNVQCGNNTKSEVSFPEALTKGVRVTGSVCGWVILFRVLIAFLERWVLWLLPETASLTLIGLLELSNGCYSLLQIQSESVRFIISTVMLSFGGICVGMQTVSVTGKLGTGWYFPGKLLQGAVSLFLAVLMAQFLFGFSKEKTVLLIVGFTATVLWFAVFSACKKTVAFPCKRVYNR